jgi:hypothetical protein
MEEEENDQLDNLTRSVEDEIFLNNDLDNRGLSESEGSTVAGSDSSSDSDSANSDLDELEFDAYDPDVRNRNDTATLSNDLDDMLVRSAKLNNAVAVVSD